MKKTLFLFFIPLLIIPFASSSAKLVKHDLNIAGTMNESHQSGTFLLPIHKGSFCKGFFCCGDDVCDINEDCESCEKDCGVCPTKEVEDKGTLRYVRTMGYCNYLNGTFIDGICYLEKEKFINFKKYIPFILLGIFSFLYLHRRRRRKNKESSKKAEREEQKEALRQEMLEESRR